MIQTSVIEIYVWKQLKLQTYILGILLVRNKDELGLASVLNTLLQKKLLLNRWNRIINDWNKMQSESKKTKTQDAAHNAHDISCKILYTSI